MVFCTSFFCQTTRELWPLYFPRQLSIFQLLKGFLSLSLQNRRAIHPIVSTIASLLSFSTWEIRKVLSSDFWAPASVIQLKCDQRRPESKLILQWWFTKRSYFTLRHKNSLSCNNYNINLLHESGMVIRWLKISLFLMDPLLLPRLECGTLAELNLQEITFTCLRKDRCLWLRKMPEIV